MSVPSLNTAVTTDNPWIDSERMDSRLPTPLSSLSMGRVTSASTCSGARPGASDCTVTWGWTNSGKTSSFACAATKIPYPTSTDASAMTTPRKRRADWTMRFSMRRQSLVWCLRNTYTFAAMDFGRRLGASDEHIPQWICKERATTPPSKRHAALRVAPNLARGFVARSVEYRCGYTPSLAPRHGPNWGQRTYAYL